MAHIEALNDGAASGPGAMETLYWWRNRAPLPDPDRPMGLSVARLAALTDVDALIAVEDLPGNAMRARAAQRAASHPMRDAVRDAAADVELLAAIRAEKTNAFFAVATGILATAAPAAAVAYAAMVHDPVAMGLAGAGMLAATFALAQGIRSLVTACRLTLPMMQERAA